MQNNINVNEIKIGVADFTNMNQNEPSEPTIAPQDKKELLLTKNLPMSTPSLSRELRAQADTKYFASNATLILNNIHNSRDKIIESLLRKLFEDNTFKCQKSEKLVKMASEALVIHNTDNDGDFLQFSKTIQGFVHEKDGTMSVDPSWLVCMASLPDIDKRIVGITTTTSPINMGSNNSSVNILAVVLTPNNEKQIKGDVETGKNIATILGNLEFRQAVHMKEIDDKIFRDSFLETANNFIWQDHNQTFHSDCSFANMDSSQSVCFGRGIYGDIRRRIQNYKSDYLDSFADRNSVLKTLIAISFLYFSNLLPTIAFGMLNERITDGKMSVAMGLISQCLGGVLFALLSGQHLTPLLTTVPISIVISVLLTISKNLQYDFFTFYAWVGIFNALYLSICAVSGLSKIMKFSRRSIEETFSFFIAVAYIISVVDAFSKVVRGDRQKDTQEESLLYIVLILGALYLSYWLHHFTKTPFLNPICRTILSGFALPISVLLFTTIRWGFFTNVKMANFNAPVWQNVTISTVNLSTLPLSGIISAAAVAIPVTILFFISHNISSSIVNSSSNKLKKGPSYHFDILLLGLINMVLSLIGVPWLNGAPLHASLHVKSLATIEEHVDQSNHITQRVVRVVETRLSSIVANLMIGASLFMMPYPLLYLPSPVLNAVFLYIALISFQSNQLFQRLVLLITEQTAYPPNHFLKRVPQKGVHLFTLIQSLQLIALCAIGFAPYVYVRIMFPVVLIIQLASRHVILPRIISTSYLAALDKTV